MTVASSELIQARQAISDVLDELGLDAYLFETEPRESQWELKVECAVEGGWSTYTLQVTEQLLTAGSEDTRAHELLLEQCREVLVACKRKT